MRSPWCPCLCVPLNFFNFLWCPCRIKGKEAISSSQNLLLFPVAQRRSIAIFYEKFQDGKIIDMFSIRPNLCLSRPYWAVSSRCYRFKCQFVHIIEMYWRMHFFRSTLCMVHVRAMNCEFLTSKKHYSVEGPSVHNTCSRSTRVLLIIKRNWSTAIILLVKQAGIIVILYFSILFVGWFIPVAPAWSIGIHETLRFTLVSKTFSRTHWTSDQPIARPLPNTNTE
jgi:hypothetical protein